VISTVHVEGDDGAAVTGTNAFCSGFELSWIRHRRKLSWLIPSFSQNSRALRPLFSNREIRSCQSPALRRTLPVDVLFIITSE
jgi:hypothetical protein